MAKFKLLALAAVTAGVLAYIGAVRSGDNPPQPPAVPAAEPPAAQLVPRATECVFKSKNFVVHAPTETMARVIAFEAEHHRRALARKWVDRELPAWAKPCVIRYTPALGKSNGMSTLTFGRNKAGVPELDTVETELRGEFLQVLTNALPHEVTHAVLATTLARPLPRWADEGIALLAESQEEQDAHDAQARELLNAGRGLRLRVLFRATEYPKDLAMLYAQGHSVARFLATRPALAGANPHRRLIKFIEEGSADNTTDSWTKAVNAVYGFDSLDALEEAWLAWLKRAGAAPRLKEKSDTGDTIPPTNIPTAKPRQ